MNPLHWNRFRQSALVFAFLFGGGVGTIIGLNKFDPQTQGNLVLLVGGAGAILSAMADYAIQVLRNRN